MAIAFAVLVAIKTRLIRFFWLLPFEYLFAFHFAIGIKAISNDTQANIIVIPTFFLWRLRFATHHDGDVELTGR